MLRVLFILLAIVSAAVAFLMERPILYVAAGALLLIAVVLVVLSLRRRRKKANEPYVRPSVPQEELKDLGILEIRARERERPLRSVGHPDKVTAGEDVPDDITAETTATRRPGPGMADGATGQPPTLEPEAPARPAPPREAPVDTLSTVEGLRPRTRPFAHFEGLSEGQRDVVAPYLQSLRAAIGAHTVCLLKQEDETPHYDIEAIVSQSAFTRSHGHFFAKVLLLLPEDAGKAVSVRNVGKGGLPAEALGYYREPVKVKQILLAPVRRARADAPAHFLLADVTEPDGLASARQRDLLAQYARLLARLIETPDTSAAADEATARPRREIIAEEMARARAEATPLALALVYVHAPDEDDAAVLELDDEVLIARLREGVPDGRAEHFGERTFGVFFDAGVPEVERWALELQQRLAEVTGLSAHDVSIGVALLDERHDTPEALREDATEALREAFETGTCVILE